MVIDRVPKRMKLKVTAVKSAKAALLVMPLLALPFPAAWAHGINQPLGGTPGAVDLFEITCSTDGGGTTEHLYVQVRDEAPAPKPNPLVSVQVHKGRTAGNATDRGPDGDAKFSPPVQVHGGNGVYYVQVDKSGRGAEIYSLEYHCQNSDGGHTGTSLFQTQND